MAGDLSHGSYIINGAAFAGSRRHHNHCRTFTDLAPQFIYIHTVLLIQSHSYELDIQYPGNLLN